MQELKRYHPFVVTVFVFTLMAWDTLVSHPLIHLMILILSWMYLLEFPKISLGKVIGGNLILMALTMLSNPLFQHRGIYILFTIWDTPITLESLAFGVDLGCMLSGILNLFRIYSHMVHTDQILYMITRISPNAAILCSLSISQMSRLQRQYQDIHTARGLMIQPTGIGGRIKENMAQISMLITWLMETSVETSLSMRSRGYGDRKRSCYAKYQMERRDRWFLLFETVIIVVSVYASYGFSFWWYPTFYMELQMVQAVLFCVSVLLFAMVPLFLKGKESVLWDNIESI